MMVESVEILGGRDRHGGPEAITRITLRPGDTLAVVGPTGSGKSELLSDVEQITDGDTPSGRRVLIQGWTGRSPVGAVATLSQRTNFLMDTDVATFVERHATCLDKAPATTREAVVTLANTLCGEPIRPDDSLQGLSGGQTRALMIADIALISAAPIILLDEIENAGIDKMKALAALSAQGKIIVTATHDPVLVLLSQRRVVMRHGGMAHLRKITPAEMAWRDRLRELDAVFHAAREALRAGESLPEESIQCPI